jgi:hypothetical protein
MSSLIVNAHIRQTSVPSWCTLMICKNWSLIMLECHCLSDMAWIFPSCHKQPMAHHCLASFDTQDLRDLEWRFRCPTYVLYYIRFDCEILLLNHVPHWKCNEFRPQNKWMWARTPLTCYSFNHTISMAQMIHYIKKWNHNQRQNILFWCCCVSFTFAWFLTYPSTLKIVEVASNKTSLNFYQTTWREVPDDGILKNIFGSASSVTWD